CHLLLLMVRSVAQATRLEPWATPASRATAAALALPPSPCGLRRTSRDAPPKPWRRRAPQGEGGSSLIDLRHRHLGAHLDRRERRHVAERLGEDVARARQPRLAAPGDRRAAEADGDCRTVGPVGDLAGSHHGARVLLARNLDRRIEIDLLAP